MDVLENPFFFDQSTLLVLNRKGTCKSIRSFGSKFVCEREGSRTHASSKRAWSIRFWCHRHFRCITAVSDMWPWCLRATSSHSEPHGYGKTNDPKHFETLKILLYITVLDHSLVICWHMEDSNCWSPYSHVVVSKNGVLPQSIPKSHH